MSKYYLGDKIENLLGNNLISMLDDIIYRIREKNKDCFILILGMLGDGKTTLGSELCYYVDKSFTDKRTIFRDFHYWRIKSNLTKAYDPIRKPDACKCKAFQFDEVKRVLLAKRSQSEEVTDVELSLNDVRSLGFFMTGCIDEIKSATRWIRESRVQIVLYIPRIPEVWIYKLYKGEDDSPNVTRYIEKIKEELLDGNYPYTPFKSSFHQIDPKSRFWIDYSKRKAKYQIKTDETKAQKEKLKLQTAIEDLIADTLSASQTSKSMHISRETLRRWIKKKKIKAIKTIKGNRFKIIDVEKLANSVYGGEDLLREYKKPKREEFET
jgi:excisionase family DNA binding protein